MTPPLRLLTIPFSHYCDKARWALHRAGLTFTEEPHLPMASAWAAWRAGGRRTVPVLVTPGGVLHDSTDMLHYADAHTAAPRRLFPDDPALRAEVAELEDDFDRRLGPATRRWAYGYLLDDADFMRAVFRSAGPRGEARVATAALPLVRAVMKRGLAITPDGVARSASRIEATFAEVGERLRDGRKYLAGSQFSAADLTFAALAAPAVIPDGYARYLCPWEALPSRFREAVAPLRDTPAGRFVVRLYETEREALA